MEDLAKTRKTSWPTIAHFARLLCVLSLVSLIVAPARAATLDKLQTQKKQLDTQQQQTAAQKKDSEDQANQLQQQLTSLNSQIGATQNALQSTQTDISTTQTKLADTKNKISDAEAKLKQTQDLLAQFVSEEYMGDTNQLLTLFFSSKTLSSFYQQLQEYEAFQQRLSDLTNQVEKLKTDLETTKSQHEADLSHFESLSRQQAIQKQSLVGQQQTKDQLLSNTKQTIADLSAEQQRLNQAETQVQNEIQQAIAEEIRRRAAASANGGGPMPADGTPVHRGQLLGYVGSTGNSTGNHLHFEARNAQGVPFDSSGEIADDVPLEAGTYTITQGFGWTSYASSGAYNGSIHTGVDLAAPAGTPIHVARDGYIIFRKYYGGYGNAVMTADNDGTYNIYGHMLSL